jgi:hypothetical protein
MTCVELIYPQDTVAEEFFRAHGARRIVSHNAIRQPSR